MSLLSPGDTPAPRPITDATVSVVGQIGRKLAAGDELTAAETGVLRLWLAPIADELRTLRHRQDAMLHTVLTTARQLGVEHDFENVLPFPRD